MIQLISSSSNFLGKPPSLIVVFHPEYTLRSYRSFRNHIKVHKTAVSAFYSPSLVTLLQNSRLFICEHIFVYFYTSAYTFADSFFFRRRQPEEYFYSSAHTLLWRASATSAIEKSSRLLCRRFKPGVINFSGFCLINSIIKSTIASSSNSKSSMKSDVFSNACNNDLESSKGNTNFHLKRI